MAAFDMRLDRDDELHEVDRLECQIRHQSGFRLDAAGEVQVWVSAESAVVRFARSWLKSLGFPRKQQLIIGYWNRGVDEVSYGRATDHDRVEGELETILPGQEEDHHHGSPRYAHDH